MLSFLTAQHTHRATPCLLNTTTGSCLLTIVLCCALQAEQEADFGEGTQTLDLLPPQHNHRVLPSDHCAVLCPTGGAGR